MIWVLSALIQGYTVAVICIQNQKNTLIGNYWRRATDLKHLTLFVFLFCW